MPGMDLFEPDHAKALFFGKGASEMKMSKKKGKKKKDKCCKKYKKKGKSPCKNCPKF